MSKKQFTELSTEELEAITGGSGEAIIASNTEDEQKKRFVPITAASAPSPGGGMSDSGPVRGT